MTYEIVEADGGSLPTIIDSETGACVLSIDTRTVDGTTYFTPVFANGQIARRVLRALNEPIMAGSETVEAPGAYVKLGDGTYAEQCGFLAWQGDDAHPCLWAKSHQGPHSWDMS